jgi:hypothetical protein
MPVAAFECKGLIAMSAPTPPASIERYYRLDSEYIADAENMQAAGWRLIAVRHTADNTIVATYAYGAITPAAPEQTFSPAYPVPPSRYTRSGSSGANIIRLLFLLVMLAVSVTSRVFISRLPLPAYTPSASATYYANTDSITAICATMTASAPASIQPTATSSATDLTGATLGGVYDAFGTLFGCEGASGTWYDVNFHGQVVTLEAGGSQNTSQSGLTSRDGRNRVFAVTVSWYHYPVPDLASRRALVARFFPPDSASLGANTKVTPTEYLYHSATLAAMFDPGAFVNSAYQTVAPGTFSEVCDAARCTVQIGDWDWV